MTQPFGTIYHEDEDKIKSFEEADRLSGPIWKLLGGAERFQRIEFLLKPRCYFSKPSAYDDYVRDVTEMAKKAGPGISEDELMQRLDEIENRQPIFIL